MNHGNKLTASAARLWRETKRRRVLQTAVAYMVAAWLIVEISATVFPALLLPEWTVRIVVVLLFLGFPLVLVLAWVFDIQKTSPPGAEAHLPGESIRERTESEKSLPPAPASNVASLAILPFRDLSGDEENRFLAEGIATELHGTLARTPHLQVVARSSSFAAGSADADVREIATKLNAGFVLSGSVRKASDRIRVIAELDDGHSGMQVWSDSYDRAIEDLFSVQQDIASEIAAALGGAMLKEEIRRAGGQSTRDLDAWGLVQRARSYVLAFRPEALSEATSYLRQAIELDPRYALAHAVLASVLGEQVLNGMSESRDDDRNEALDSAETATSLAPSDPFVLKMAGATWAYFGEAGKSLSALRRAVELSPYDFGAWGYLGWPLVETGRAEDLAELRQIMARMLASAPAHPGAPYWLYHCSVASNCVGEDDAALAYSEQATSRNPAFPWGWLHHANVLAIAGRQEQAERALDRAASLVPAMSAGHYEWMIRQMHGTGGSSRVRGIRSLRLPPPRP